MAATQYGDRTTGKPSSTLQETYTVNALGQQKTMTDRNGNVHTYSFDVLGRQTSKPQKLTVRYYARAQGGFAGKVKFSQ